MATTNIWKGIYVDEEEAMQSPSFLLAPPYVEPPVPDDVTSHNRWFERLHHVSWQVACARKIQGSQRESGSKILCPCSWCGLPTGDWCEGCIDSSQGPMMCICSYCDRYMRRCRLCRLELQNSPHAGSRKTKTLPNSAYLGHSTCSGCGASGLFQLCGACQTCHFCSRECLAYHWPQHKPLCRFLQIPQPLSFVYPWHMRRALSLCEIAPELLPPPADALSC